MLVTDGVPRRVLGPDDGLPPGRNAARHARNRVTAGNASPGTGARKVFEPGGARVEDHRHERRGGLVSTTALALVVAAALADAAWNLCAKLVPSGGAVFVWLTGTISAVLQLPVAVVVADAVGQGVPATWWFAILGSGFLHLAYFVLLQRGYRHGDLSVVYPLARGTGPALSVLAAVLLLGERPGVGALLGAGAVVVGVWVIGGLGAGAGSDTTGRAAGVGYGVAVGVVIAGYTLWDAHAVTTLAVPPLVLLAGTPAVVATLLTPYALRRRTEVRRIWQRHRLPVLAVAVLSPLAYLLILLALRLAPVSMVAPARELSIVLGSLAAWLLLGEPNPVRRLVGAVVVLGGVAAISLA